MTIVRGIDVARYQTVTSWASVAKAVDFVVVKATEGTSSVSPTWRKYFAGARAAGLLTGSYHFGHPKNSPVAEARHYVAELEAVGWCSGRDLPPVLDIEAVEGKTKAGLTDWVLEFVNAVDDQLGLTQPWLRCGFYCNRDYYNSRMTGSQVHNGRWLWLAAWPNPTGPWPAADNSIPAGAALWQWTDKARIPGIAENTDGNVARIAELQQLAPNHYGTTPPKPAPPAPVEEDPLAGITIDQIRAVVRDEVRYAVKPGDGAKRIAGDYSKELAEKGAPVASFAVGADARTRALVRAVDALADGMEPAVRDAVREALRDAVVDVDVNVNTPEQQA